MATYFVSTTGSDSTGTGAQLNPWRTIQRGVTPLVAGDTLYIRGGAYDETVSLSGKNGTALNRILFSAYPGEPATIRPPLAGMPFTEAIYTYFTFDGFIIDGVNQGSPSGQNANYAWNFHEYNPHNIIKNVEVKNTWSTCIFIGRTGVANQPPFPDDILVQNCTLHDTRSLCAVADKFYGIYLAQGSNITLEGNTIYNTSGGGIQAYPGPISSTIIRGNRVRNSINCALSFNGAILIGTNGVDPNTNTQCYNNLIYNNGIGGNPDGITVYSNPNGTKLWNNTITGNSGYAIRFAHTTASNTVIQNNIFYNNTLGTISGSGINSTIDHNISTDPLFVNSGTGDFHLLTGSPAINAGVALVSVTIDFDSVSRGNPPEVGAYEFLGGADVTPPAVPTGLAVS